MYNQDPKLRRRRDRLRFFGYGAMTIATVLLAIISVYFVLGYRLNKSFQVEQGGLVKFDSRPRAATITFDGVKTNQTRYQLNADAGNHAITYARAGYETWQKNVTLHAGEVLWLEYAKLIPTNITTAPVAELTSVHQSSTAFDRKTMLIHQTANSPDFTVVNANNEDKPELTNIVLPATAYTAAEADRPSVFEIAMWSRDSNFVLIKHTFGNENNVEYIRVPVDQPERAENLTQLFNLKLQSLRFAEGSNAVLFGVDEANTLLRLDRGDPQKPTTVATKVITFDELDESHVAYVAQPTDQPTQRILYIWQKGGKRTTIKTIAGDATNILQYNRYYSHTYLTEVLGGSVNVTEDPLNTPRKTAVSETLSFTPAVAQASPGNRFVMMQSGESLSVYDFELARLYSFTSPGETRTPLQWADDHHLALTGGSATTLVEFDGTNAHRIAATAGTADVLVGTEGRSMLSIGRAATGDTLQLQTSALFTEADR